MMGLEALTMAEVAEVKNLNGGTLWLGGILGMLSAIGLCEVQFVSVEDDGASVFRVIVGGAMVDVVVYSFVDEYHVMVGDDDIGVFVPGRDDKRAEALIRSALFAVGS